MLTNFDNTVTSASETCFELLPFSRVRIHFQDHVKQISNFDFVMIFLTLKYNSISCLMLKIRICDILVAGKQKTRIMCNKNDVVNVSPGKYNCKCPKCLEETQALGVFKRR